MGREYLSGNRGEVYSPHQEEHVEVPSDNGETILLVEDDTAIQQPTEAILEELGYIVHVFSKPCSSHERELAITVREMLDEE